MVCYLVNETGRYVDIVHQRPHDTHETLRLDGPVWKIIRQREAPSRAEGMGMGSDMVQRKATARQVLCETRITSRMFITKGRHRRRGHRWSNVWPFPRIPSKKLRHPAEKPIGLVRRAIEASSDPGQLVIDPFSGSGTTAEAAAISGRSVLVGDIDPAMVRMTCERVGLPVPSGLEEAPPAPPCPVFNVAPPSPALWGVHPEDLAYAMERPAAGENGKVAT